MSTDLGMRGTRLTGALARQVLSHAIALPDMAECNTLHSRKRANGL